MEYTHNILHVSDHLPPYVAIACVFGLMPQCALSTEQEQCVDIYLILSAIPAIHETNALREVF